MPTYEYECTVCGNRVEVFQRLSADPLTVCEVCGGALRKLFHPVGIAFKGSGFYVTDSRSSPGTKTKKKSGGDSSTKKKTDSGSSDGSGATSAAS